MASPKLHHLHLCVFSYGQKHKIMTKKKGKEKRSSILLSKSCKTTLLFHKTCVCTRCFCRFLHVLHDAYFDIIFFSFEKRHRKRIHTETFSFSQLFFSALRSLQCSFHWPPFNCIELMHMRKENNQTWSSITNQKPSIKNIVIQIKIHPYHRGDFFSSFSLFSAWCKTKHRKKLSKH